MLPLDSGFYLQALDTFNTAVISPVYYVMFTSLTIIASMIMFKVTYTYLSDFLCKAFIFAALPLTLKVLGHVCIAFVC